MKKTFLIFTLLIALIGTTHALTAGDIAIIGVNTDNPDELVVVALVDIAEGTQISFTDNAWNATTETWRGGEGTDVWTCPTGGLTKGSVVSILPSSMALSGSGDQVLAYEGTTAPTSNTDSTWLYGFSTENWVWADSSTSSDLPTALIGASVGLTDSTTEVDNAYFADGIDPQTSVVLSGTKTQLLVYFTDNTLYYTNNTGPLTFPSYSITVLDSGINVPPMISNITQSPFVEITSTTSVSVSADVTDSDGTVSLVQLQWGTVSGSYPSTINMSPGTGDTYTADTDIPAQPDGTTVYYVVYAEDDESDSSTSTEQSYDVNDPATTTIPYTQDFSSGWGDTYLYDVSGTANWYIYNDDIATCNGYNQTTLEEHWLILPGIDFDNYAGERMTFNTIATYGTIDANNYLKLMYSADYPGLGDPTGYTWAEIPFANGGVGGGETPSGVLDLSSISGTNVYLGFMYYSTDDPTRWEVDDISIYLSTPVITVNPTSLGGFTYEYLLGPSSEQTFTVSGADLQGDIILTAPANYEISLTTGTGYTSPITLTAAKLDVNETTIYTRLKAGLAIGTYNDEIINITSPGAPAQTVSCSGEVTAPPPPDTPATTAGTEVTEDGFTAHWDPVAGATGYYLDVYTGDEIELINTSFEGSTSFPDGWTQNSSYISNNSSNAYTGTYYAGMNGVGDYFYTPLLSSPTTISFWARTSWTTTDNTINIQYSTDASSWTDLAIYTADGNDTGDITFVYSQKTIDANLSGDYYIRWYMSARTGGSIYFDDILITSGTSTYVPGYENLDVGNVTSYPVTGLDPNTTYYYVVRAYNDYGTSEDSNPTEVITEEEGPVPVELASFTATISAQNYVSLTWVTHTETGLSGYYVQRANTDDLAEAITISPMIDAHNASQMQTYTFTDEELYESGTYYYWLQSVDLDGSGDFHGPVSVYYNVNGENNPPEIPSVTELKAVYPNPFNPVAFIPYSIANETEVSFKIYNSRGQVVRSFELGTRLPGEYRITWDGRDYKGNALSNGVYHIRMIAGEGSYQRKAVLIK